MRPTEDDVPCARPGPPIGPLGRVVRVPQDPDADEAYRALLPHAHLRELLPDFLCFLVPIAIHELSSASAEHLAALRTELIEDIAAHGDDLMFGGRDQKSARVALVKALAILATAEGGVTILGVHACTEEHEGCPGSFPTGSS
ncbi:hypothetical protein [Streptomyces alboflavus]|uniref:hypothetical protein n=1 Tax=Streptomyces alboflavus TaxID=67267 RepID=UPI0013316156|nr:hypothetical protein [Streptomyces alboflavus]